MNFTPFLLLGVSLLVLSIGMPVNQAAFAMTDREIPQLERQIADKINEYRKSLGLTELRYDSKIAEVARGHSDDMKERKYFDHITKDTVGKNAAIRGAEAGYGLCGDSAALDRYNTTVKGIAEHKKRIAEFEKEAETVRLFWSDDPLRVQQIDVKYAELIKIEKQVNSQTMKTYDDINKGRIGIGFSENISQIRNGALSDNLRELSDGTVKGWIESPIHERVLRDHGNSLGVGVSVVEDNLLVTLNVC